MSTLTSRYGFQIDEYFDLQGWRVLELADVPITVVPACPADDVPLRTLCTLTSRVDGMTVRIGCCPECGHVTYIDRPTQEWIYRYYLETWDSPGERETGAGRSALLEKLARADQGRVHETVRLARTLSIDRSLAVCEIGCGFGGSLRQLAASGFTRLAATEASRHRAEIARDGGFDVVAAPFEAAATQAALRDRGPFSLILTFHVLEHTYHPDRIFAAAAALQKPGSHLIASVPNQEGEPSMGVLLFLPHLHSFTPVSLARLAARNGYEVADDRANTAKTLNVVFRRTARPAEVGPLPNAYRGALTKIVTNLELDQTHLGKRRLWWSRRADIAGQVWAGPPASLGEWNWQRFLDRERIERPRSMLVSSLQPNGGAPEAPLAIDYSGQVGLFFK
jgi:SAM-dependent methyltransferase